MNMTTTATIVYVGGRATTPKALSPKVLRSFSNMEEQCCKVLYNQNGLVVELAVVVVVVPVVRWFSLLLMGFKGLLQAGAHLAVFLNGSLVTLFETCKWN